MNLVFWCRRVHINVLLEVFKLQRPNPLLIAKYHHKTVRFMLGVSFYLSYTVQVFHVAAKERVLNDNVMLMLNTTTKLFDLYSGVCFQLSYTVQVLYVAAKEKVLNNVFMLIAGYLHKLTRLFP